MILMLNAKLKTNHTCVLMIASIFFRGVQRESNSKFHDFLHDVPEVLNVQMNEIFFPILCYSKILFQIQMKISIISF